MKLGFAKATMTMASVSLALAFGACEPIGALNSGVSYNSPDSADASSATSADSVASESSPALPTLRKAQAPAGLEGAWTCTNSITDCQGVQQITISYISALDFYELTATDGETSHTVVLSQPESGTEDTSQAEARIEHGSGPGPKETTRLRLNLRPNKASMAIDSTLLAPSGSVEDGLLLSFDRTAANSRHF